MSQQLDAKAIFMQALELGSEEAVQKYLDEACSEPELRQEVESLIQAHGEAGEFLGGESSQTETRGVASECLGESIGPYKLLQQLGEGGMGVVYLAERQHPVKQRVALKIIKHGMDSKQFVARFEAERQALAMMDHPNIAKVLDAGCTEQGRPYFVMELVKGIPISEFCDENRLTTRERLELFVPVCQAVHHAHQKGIIHRDLKPSNVLVALYDDKPVPKVIDFGVAKATNQQLTEKTLFTEVGSILGTWEYMSPEQAVLNQLDVDTRTDVYSLGVLLYELLTGETPLDRQKLREAQVMETLRMIREDEPLKPSTRLSSLGNRATATAAYRKSKPDTLASEVRGDLDWIVMKALDKDRSRRYDSANRFAEDLERYLNHEMVEARPPSLLYQVRAFTRRNRALTTSLAAIIAALGLGLIVAVWGVKRANDAVAALEAEQVELKEAQNGLKNSLNSLGDAAMKLALQNALNGNREQTTRALETASEAGVDGDRITLIKACLELYVAEGRQDVTMDMLSKLIERNQNNIAARALLANAILWSGKRPPEEHYSQLEELQKMIPAVLEGQQIDIEARIFLGQAVGRIDPATAIKILKPAVDESQSPVARLLLSQALSDHSVDAHDGESARLAYQHASAAHLSLPDSSMANALHIWACHVAQRFNADGHRDWYLAEARKLAEIIDDESTAVERLTEGFFLAEDTSNTEHIHNDWSMVKKGRMVRGPASRILWHSPERYAELINDLESKLDGDEFNWYEASTSLLLLKALSKERHEGLRTHIKEIDKKKRVYFPIDRRVYALAATLMMDGRKSATAQAIARELRANTVTNHNEPDGLADYVLGELREADFLTANRTTRGKWGHAELFVGLAYIGEGSREKAIEHLEKSYKADNILGMHWWALSIHNLLRDKDPLMDWVGKNHEGRQRKEPVREGDHNSKPK